MYGLVNAHKHSARCKREHAWVVNYDAGIIDPRGVIKRHLGKCGYELIDLGIILITVEHDLVRSACILLH